MGNKLTKESYKTYKRILRNLQKNSLNLTKEELTS